MPGSFIGQRGGGVEQVKTITLQISPGMADLRELLCYVELLYRVQLFVIPWTVACQASLSMDSPGKNARVGGHALLQRIFPTQESNPGLPALAGWFFTS